EGRHRAPSGRVVLPSASRVTVALTREPALTDVSSDLRVFMWNRGAVTLLQVGGEIDLATADVFSDHLELAIASGAGDVLDDASGVTFCDAAMVRGLMVAYQQLRSAGRRLTVVNGSGPVDRVLH